MVWAIATPLIVIALSFFLIMIALVIMMKRATSVLEDIEDKLYAINPLCRIIYRLGDIIENKMEDWEERKRSRCWDIADWVACGVALFEKFRRK